MKNHPAVRRSSLATSVALLAVALSYVACPQSEGPQAPGDPVAVLTVPGETTVIELGQSIDLSGIESHLGENTEGLGLTLSWFWNLDSKPAGSALVDESLVPVGAVAGDDDSGDDDSADGERDEDDGETPEGSLVSLTPDVQGIYGVTLQVGDGTRLSNVEHVAIQVGGGNECPVANAGVDAVAATGTPVALDGSASTDADVEGGDSEQVLYYAWHLSLVPADSAIDDSDIFYQGTWHPLIIPDEPGSYILQLRVMDGLCTSLPDYVTVFASDGNLAPVADAGQSQVLTPCSPTQVSLDGSGSYDPEGQSIDFEWSLTSVPNGSDVANAFLDGRFTASPSFNWDVPGIYTLELRVDDGELESQPDYVAVQAVPPLPNGAPVANAGEDVLLDVSAACISGPYGGGNCNPCNGRSVILDAAGSYDPDGDEINYQWDLQSGNVQILGVGSRTLEVIFPDLAVSYGGVATLTAQLGLTVFDCRAADDDTITVTFMCTGD